VSKNKINAPPSCLRVPRRDTGDRGRPWSPLPFAFAFRGFLAFGSVPYICTRVHSLAGLRESPCVRQLYQLPATDSRQQTETAAICKLHSPCTRHKERTRPVRRRRHARQKDRSLIGYRATYTISALHKCSKSRATKRRSSTCTHISDTDAHKTARSNILDSHAPSPLRPPPSTAPRRCKGGAPREQKDLPRLLVTSPQLFPESHARSETSTER
jgi:hypothetical protein